MVAEIVLVSVNLLAGVGCAIPISRLLRNATAGQVKFSHWLVILLGVYFVECAVLVFGMGIPVLSVALAFIWGIAFGRWLRSHTPVGKALRAAALVSLFSSLPALSFVLVPLMAWLGGWSVLSAAAGAGFGIPEFLPWPLSTILGFYVAMATGALLLKAVITTGEVSLLIHLTRPR